jgi:hypothetical protein
MRKSMLILVVAIILVMAIFAERHYTNSRPPGAGVEIMSVGTPLVDSLSVDSGECDPIIDVNYQGESFRLARCGVPLGERTFMARCKNPTLPTAMLRVQIGEGDSHGVTFRNVCSSTPDEIKRENNLIIRKNKSVWDTKWPQPKE